MPILVGDANIFIDLEAGGLIAEAFSLPERIEVPDLLFHDELEADHGDLVGRGLGLGELDEEGMRDLMKVAVNHPGISRNDSAALALARQYRCTLVTGDARLREAAQTEGVRVHGTIWLVERMLDESLITEGDARSAFERMRNGGRRLPWEAAEQMLRSRGA